MGGGGGGAGCEDPAESTETGLPQAVQNLTPAWIGLPQFEQNALVMGSPKVPRCAARY